MSTIVAIHVGKLYTKARQFSLPGREPQWVASRLVSLLKAGKLVGFSQSPSGWEKVIVKELPERMQIRGVSPETAAEISSAFWKLVSENR